MQKQTEKKEESKTKKIEIKKARFTQAREEKKK